MPTGSEEPTSVNLGAILEGLIEAGVDFILVDPTQENFHRS